MLKKLMMVMGVVLVGIVGSCALVLGKVGIDAAGEAPQNRAVAAAVTRDLARAWDVNDLKPHFVDFALSQVNFGQAQLSFNALKALGALMNVEQASQTEFRYDKKIGGVTTKTATILMVAEFENGRASVTVKLMSEGDAMKLLHINVAPIGNVRAKRQEA